MTTDDLPIIRGMIIDAVEASVKATVPEEIKKTVNGKIDGLRVLMETNNEKHEADMKEVREHIVEVKPLLDTYRGGKVLGEIVKWIAGVGIAALTVKSWLKL